MCRMVACQMNFFFTSRHYTLFTICKDIKKVFTTKKKGLKNQSLF